MGLWNELDNYMKTPACNCGAAAKIAKFREEDKVHQFLMGLDDDSDCTAPNVSFWRLCSHWIKSTIWHNRKKTIN